MQPNHASRARGEFDDTMTTQRIDRPPVSGEVRLPAAGAELVGDFSVPAPLNGMVIFAHGSGSSRKSPRNRFVAGRLRQAGLATLLVDLLTSEEERLDLETGLLRFDIPFLTRRLLAATDWVLRQPGIVELPLGYFGASTGAAAALLAAAERPDRIHAVVSRGGRPDLAGSALRRVAAPTLLLVGGADPQVLELNRAALARMRCEAELRIVPGATHLFPESGALEEVARHAAAWFERHMGSPDWAVSPNERLESSVRGE
jgi:dienelactone hydrolase